MGRGFELDFLRKGRRKPKRLHEARHRHCKASSMIERYARSNHWLWGQAADRNLTREAGFDFHLVKPVSIGEIASMFPESLLKSEARVPPELAGPMVECQSGIMIACGTKP